MKQIKSFETGTLYLERRQNAVNYEMIKINKRSFLKPVFNIKFRLLLMSKKFCLGFKSINSSNCLLIIQLVYFMLYLIILWCNKLSSKNNSQLICIKNWAFIVQEQYLMSYLTSCSSQVTTYFNLFGSLWIWRPNNSWSYNPIHESTFYPDLLCTIDQNKRYSEEAKSGEDGGVLDF